jgi:hypothetical protein
MNTYRLPYVVVFLLLFLASCDSGNALDEYNETLPVTVTISGLSSVFSPGTMLYIGIMRDESWSILKDGYYKAQGHAPVGADGRVEISLHSPTGVPFKVLDKFEEKGTVFILNNNKEKIPLYKTGDIGFASYIAHISLSFASDFTAVSE